MTNVEILREKVSAGFPALCQDLADFVRIPSVSAAAFDQKHVQESAEWVAAKFGELGLETRILQANTPSGDPGRPAVVASKAAQEGYPTVLLYAHHDVQPPGEESTWESPAFTPTERNGRLYGRGAADDGAGVVTHLGALRALGQTPLGLRIFIEGEEEIGSPSFANFLETYWEDLAADVIVIADSSNWKVGTAALTTTLRGLVDCEVELRVLDHAVHSGMYGGPVLDAVTLMARLIATLHNEDGSVAVAGLEGKETADVEYAESDFRGDVGAVAGLKLAGRGDLASRLWTQPALSVIGMDVTSVRNASNTIAPSCRARLSLRIAPGQDPQSCFMALSKHLQSHVPFGAAMEIIAGDMGASFACDVTSPAAQKAMWALEQAWGTPAVCTGIGGSIPFTADFVKAFPQAEVLITGVEDPHSQAHSENESVHLGELENVVLAEALLLDSLANR